jgi:hypothetical protein
MYFLKLELLVRMSRYLLVKGRSVCNRVISSLIALFPSCGTLCVWINLSPYFVHSLHYFSHAPLVWLASKLFYCCFSRIENIKLTISWFTCLLWIQRWDQMANLVCIRKKYASLPRGDLISALIDANATAELDSCVCSL